MTSEWDPEQYERFKAERAQPFWDLADLIDRSSTIERVVDLGCGTGELTHALVERLDPHEALGIDNSPAMLERAAAHATERLRFERGDLATWTSDRDCDLVVANASLHWAPDHPTVLRRWSDGLRGGGQLAVQVPANADHPAQRAAARVAAREPFLTALGGEPPPDVVEQNVLAPVDYAQILFDLGFSDQRVGLRVYGHVLAEASDAIEWIRGSSLTRFFSQLPAEMHEQFVDAVRTEFLADVGEHSPYFYPFKRILLWGRRPDDGAS